MDGKRFQGASEHLDNHSVMGDAFEAYLAAADARYSAYSRRFSIFGLLLTRLSQLGSDTTAKCLIHIGAGP
jgi:hypothetical protein